MDFTPSEQAILAAYALAGGRGAWSWEQLLHSLPYEILLVKTIGEAYEGDYFVLFVGPKRAIGFLCFGYGSCSGCDLLEGADTVEQVIEIRRRIDHAIVWLETPEEMRSWLLARDWSAVTPYDEEKVQPFLADAERILADLYQA